MPKLGATEAKTVQLEFANLPDFRGLHRVLLAPVPPRECSDNLKVPAWSVSCGCLAGQFKSIGDDQGDKLGGYGALETPTTNLEIQPNDQNRDRLILAAAHKRGSILQVVPVDAIAVRIVPRCKSYVFGQTRVETSLLCGGGPDVNDPSPGSAISELPKDFLSLFSPIERHVTQQFFNRQVGPMFAH